MNQQCLSISAKFCQVKFVMSRILPIWGEYVDFAISCRYQQSIANSFSYCPLAKTPLTGP